MNRPHFFCDIDALQLILDQELTGDYKDLPLVVDLIEIPHYFIYSSDEQNWTMKAYSRGEMYSPDENGGIEQGSVVVNKETGEGQIKATESLGENMGAFFHACRQLSYYLQEHNLENMADGLDPEQSGISVTDNNGQLDFTVVSGKQRPSMMCNGILGGAEMARPYMDEIIEHNMRNDLPIEEKIEKAEAGDIDFMERLALLYTNGDDETPINPEKAFYWFKKMAEAGNSDGMFNVGLYYAKGFGVPRDFAKASEWMEKAAVVGDEDAPNAMQEYAKLAECYTRALEGDAQAQAEYASGLMKFAGSLDQAGKVADYEECVKWAKLAADQECAEAMWLMALAYQHGRGVEPDMNVALDFYRRGADLRHPGCLHNLGCEYMHGENVDEDQTKAFELIKTAAEQGYGLAMRDLGRCYQFANGCTGNMKTAVEWYEKALEVLDDPDLERKVMMFKMLGENDPNWGEDY